MKPNLEEYLTQCYEKGMIDHTIRITRIDKNGKPHFYIHPSNINTPSLDFVVNENSISQKYND